MCDFCGCRDNNPVPGMRVGRWMGDSLDHQGQQNYTWTGYDVDSTPSNMNNPPPAGDQYRQQMIGGNGAQAGVDDSGRMRSSG